MLRRIITLSVALALTVAVASPALAYWEFGHETVAEIAMANVKPATRARVLALLRHSALLDTPECLAATPAEASVWPDCVKKLGDRFKSTFSWHYQDVEICEPFDLKSACKDGNCAAAQIQKDVALLKSGKGTTKDRLTALVFLIHLIGDIHQPLHAGEKGDKGGNDVKAVYGTYAPSRLNLHSIWDGYLAERAISTGPSLVRRYPPAERARIAAGDVTDWSRESWQVAHDVTYATAIGGDPCGPTPARVKLDNATIDRLIPTVRLEVKRGGLRLAKMLDAALG